MPSARVVTANDATIDEAERELLARWNEIRSVSAKVTTRFEQREGAKSSQTGAGMRDCMKKNGKMLVWSKLNNYILLDVSHVDREDGAKQLYTEQRLLRVFDGNFLYTVDERHEQMGGMKVTKSRLDPQGIQLIGGRRLFRQLRRLDRLQLLPDDTIDGKSVYVFEGSANADLVEIQYYFDKETGILLKMIVENKGENSTFMFALSDIELNVEFSEDHFTFTPPEGAEIIDLTQQRP
ncbi:MAG: hypothetical protein WBE26_19375 [Phycisphaerae bacterium]